MDSHTTLGRIKERIKEAFLQDTRFGKTCVTTEFPGTSLSFPLDTPEISVGIEKVEVSPSGFGGFIGTETKLSGDALATLEGLNASVTLRVDCYTAEQASPLLRDRLQEGIYEVLLAPPFNASTVWTEPSKAVASKFATHTCTKAVLQTVLTTAAKPVRTLADIRLSVLSHSKEEEYEL